jgi:hypothetical protein
MAVPVQVSKLAPERHPTLYIPSGDIVLSTKHRGAVHLFRVHKAVLSYHSPIFEDLFTLPPTPGVNEEYDGASMVRMPDNYQDLVSFLEVLYEQEYVLAPHFMSNTN